MNKQREYAKFIRDKVPIESHKVYGKCKYYIDLMKKKFPELKKVRGYYHCEKQGKREHFWLEDEKGYVVDPTCHQFSEHGYWEKWDESKPEPIGKCMYCGDYVFPPHMNFCCDNHKQLTVNYIRVNMLENLDCLQISQINKTELENNGILIEIINLQAALIELHETVINLCPEDDNRKEVLDLINLQVALIELHETIINLCPEDDNRKEVLEQLKACKSRTIKDIIKTFRFFHEKIGTTCLKILN